MKLIKMKVYFVMLLMLVFAKRTAGILNAD